MVDPIVTKQCSKCKRVLPLTGFHILKGRKYNRHSQCIQCRNASRKPIVKKLVPDPITEKYCTKCDRTLPISHFCKHSHTRDGWDCWCKDCKVAYANSPQGKDVIRRIRRKIQLAGGMIALQRRYHQGEKGKASRRINEKRRRILRPDRCLANQMVARAVRMGVIPRASQLACHHCGRPAELYHHYAGYGRDAALLVMPLCEDGHYAVHHPTTCQSNEPCHSNVCCNSHLVTERGMP